MKGWLLGVGAFVLAAAQIANGDIVKLRNGKSYEGIVIAETTDSVVMETYPGGVATIETFSRDDIVSMSKQPFTKPERKKVSAPAAKGKGFARREGRMGR